MKKLISAVLALALGAGMLAGCGGNANTGSSAPDNSAAPGGTSSSDTAPAGDKTLNLYTWQGMFPQEVLDGFTRETGISPAKYITRVRVEYAKLLLQDEDTSIIYVAEASGFANANYFAKVFRRETGMSPSEYLESLPQRTGHRERRQDRHPVW